MEYREEPIVCAEPDLAAVPHQVHLERGVAVPPQAVIEAEAQLLKGHANMAPVVEPLLESDTVVPPVRVILLQSVQHLQLHKRHLNGQPSSIWSGEIHFIADDLRGSHEKPPVACIKILGLR